jgi:hypothetical protein
VQIDPWIQNPEGLWVQRFAKLVQYQQLLKIQRLNRLRQLQRYLAGLSIQTNGTASFDGASTWTLTKPSGVQTGDVMFVGISWDNTATTFTPSASFTVIASGVGSGSMRTSCFFRIAQAGDTSWTWTTTGGASFGGVCLTFTGNDTVTQPDAIGSTNTNTGSATLTANAVVVAADQAYEVICVGGWNAGNASASGFTAQTNGATANSPIALLYKGPLGVGSTGTTVVTESGATSGQIIAAIPFAVRPGASAGNAPLSQRFTSTPQIQSSFNIM